eukprot:4434606-Pyramimonas_sp.AAC.1
MPVPPPNEEILERILFVAMGDTPGPDADRLRTVDPAWLNLRGDPPHGSPIERPPQEAETGLPLTPSQRMRSPEGQPRG